VRSNGQVCGAAHECASGSCVDGVCCDTACDGACEACNLAGSVGTCSIEPNGTTCGGGNICCSGTCQQCCNNEQCANPTPICVSGACTACSGAHPCADGEVCCGDSCFAGICCEDGDCGATGNTCDTHQCRCGSGDTCGGSTPDCCGSPGSCTNTNTDPANCGACGTTCNSDAPACWDGQCVCGDVCASGCRFATLQDAINMLPAGSTIQVCAGTYAPVTITKNVTIIGVGDGSDPTNNTILNGGGTSRVVAIDSGVTVSLQGLRITGGKFAGDGGGVGNRGTLTMTACTVTGNEVANQSNNVTGGGICNIGNATLTMTDCTVSNNTSPLTGGGIVTLEGQHELINCTFSGNSAGAFGGAIFCGNGGSTTLTNCTVGPANSAGISGAIGVANGSTVTLKNSQVTGNPDGGIDNINGTVNLQNGSSVSDNESFNCGGPGTYTGEGCA
jgi:predicted outer membrane repeat protein